MEKQLVEGKMGKSSLSCSVNMAVWHFGSFKFPFFIFVCMVMKSPRHRQKPFISF